MTGVQDVHLQSVDMVSLEPLPGSTWRYSRTASSAGPSERQGRPSSGDAVAGARSGASGRSPSSVLAMLSLKAPTGARSDFKGIT